MSTALWERDRELAGVKRLLVDAADARGALLAVVGPAGIGKTSVLDAGASLAREMGVRVLRARASELESSFAFGVARQLLESAVVRSSKAERDTLFKGPAVLAAPVLGVHLTEPAVAGDRQAAMLGLYWLLDNLALTQPVLLVVDDAQWADRGSLEWLRFVAARLESAAIALLVAVRPAGDAGAEIDRLLESAATVMALSPLGLESSTKLVRQAMGASVEEVFAHRCARATGGNPLLLHELVRALAQQGVQPAAENAGEVARVTSLRLERLVAVRLARTGSEAARLAKSVAILGPRTALRDAARLAGLDLESAAAASDVLRTADLLARDAQLSFVHPLIAHAIQAGIPSGERAIAHRDAARNLAAAGAPVEVVAGHLLEAQPEGDTWAFEHLLEAGEEALGRGAPTEAVTLLKRAALEGVTDESARLFRQLGTAENRLADASAIPHLEAAYALEQDAARRTDLALVLSGSMVMQGRSLDGLLVIEREINEIHAVDPHRALEVEAQLCVSARLAPGWAERVAARLKRAVDFTGETPGECAMLACLAGDLGARGVDARQSADVACRALGEGRLLESTLAESPVYFIACIALAWCDRYEQAGAHLSDAAALTRRRGSVIGLAHVAAWTSEVELRAGRLHEASSQAGLAIDAPIGDLPPRAMAAAWLILALLERDRADEAQAVLAGSPWCQDIPELVAFTPLLFARGSLRFHAREPDLALNDFLTVGRTLNRELAPSPTLLPWRSATARAYAALGSISEARAVAREECDLAQAFGAPRALGIALRGLASVAHPDDGIDLYRDAVAALEASEARLQHAHALCDLGAALRRRGNRREAREPLGLTLDLAMRCGAIALARRARDELAASGARPRRVLLSGRDALTPAELRVAGLASDGLSNREIAQALFVSVKTVETQLGHAYRKLGISSRMRLSDALAAEQPQRS